MPSILWRVCSIACLSAVVAAGIDWGLPSATSDATVFATHAPWDGRALAAFDADRSEPGDAARGADVDATPLPKSADPIPLTNTDADRAAIVRRYKLFSHQPDEMITFMALQRMRPAERQFDPQLYQYGGVWVYGVGGLLKIAAQLGLIDLRADKAFYYDHPAAFGRFYVVTRLYTLAAYALLLMMTAMILYRLTGNEAAAAVGAAVVGMLPVVFALAHEAKPHVGGAALVLATALAGARWVRTGRIADAGLSGALAGLATGTVLSAVVAVTVPVAMVFLPRPRYGPFNDSPGRRVAALAVALAAAAVAYAVTNPYVVIHAVHRDPVLSSNLNNSKAMYAIGAIDDLLTDGIRRLLEALSWPAAAIAIGGVVVAVTRRQRTRPLGVLLSIPTGLVLAQFFALAAGKPAEYARFALLPAATLGVLGVWSIATITRPSLRAIGLAAALLAVAVGGTWPYFAAFAADVTEHNTRTSAAAEITKAGGRSLQVIAEPAPYAVPPFDPWAWQAILTAPTAAPVGDVIVRATDDTASLPSLVPPGYRRVVIGGDVRPAPITWANKPFEILIRQKND